MTLRSDQQKQFIPASEMERMMGNVVGGLGSPPLEKGDQKVTPIGGRLLGQSPILFSLSEQQDKTAKGPTEFNYYSSSKTVVNEGDIDTTDNIDWCEKCGSEREEDTVKPGKFLFFLDRSPSLDSGEYSTLKNFIENFKDEVCTWGWVADGAVLTHEEGNNDTGNNKIVIPWTSIERDNPIDPGNFWSAVSTLGQYSAITHTYYADILRKAASYLGGGGSPCDSLILLTDCENHDVSHGEGQTAVEDAAAALKAQGINIYVYGGEDKPSWRTMGGSFIRGIDYCMDEHCTEEIVTGGYDPQQYYPYPAYITDAYIDEAGGVYRIHASASYRNTGTGVSPSGYEFCFVPTSSRCSSRTEKDGATATVTLGTSLVGTWKVKVRSHSIKSTGSWSELEDIRVEAPSEDPIGEAITWDTSPSVTDGDITGESANHAGGYQMANYKFQVATDSNFNNLVLDDGWQSSESFSYTGSSGNTYYIRHRGATTNRDDITDWSSTETITDFEVPTPNPMTWSSEPAASGMEISMTATTASDPDGVEYFFECTGGGGNDSGWQDSPSYTDSGLSATTTYTYRVKARDKSAEQNETDYSSEKSATTPEESDTMAPTPNPPSVASAIEWYDSNEGIYYHAIESEEVTDAEGSTPVQYEFQCGSGGGTFDSGWINDYQYNTPVSSYSKSYYWRVRARDSQGNETGWSGWQLVTTGNEPGWV